MKRTYSAIAVITMSMAVSAAATGVNQDRIPAVQRPAATDAKSITLTGCVARGTANDSYTLTEAKQSEAKSTDPAVGATVALAGTEVDLSKHVGHSVAVTGSYAAKALTIGTTGTEKPVATGAAADADKPTPRTFMVSSLKMVASSCSQPG